MLSATLSPEQIGLAATRLGRDLSACQALVAGLPVARSRLRADVLAQVGEKLAGEPLELDEVLALRIEAARQVEENVEPDIGDPTVTFAEFVARRDESAARAADQLPSRGRCCRRRARDPRREGRRRQDDVGGRPRPARQRRPRLPRPQLPPPAERARDRERRPARGVPREARGAARRTGSTAASRGSGTCPPSGGRSGSPTRRSASGCGRSSRRTRSTSSSPTRSPASACAATAPPRRRASSSSG